MDSLRPVPTVLLARRKQRLGRQRAASARQGSFRRVVGSRTARTVLWAATSRASAKKAALTVQSAGTVEELMPVSALPAMLGSSSRIPASLAARTARLGTTNQAQASRAACCVLVADIVLAEAR